MCPLRSSHPQPLRQASPCLALKGPLGPAGTSGASGRQELLPGTRPHTALQVSCSNTFSESQKQIKVIANYFLPLISQCTCYFPSIMTHLAATEQLGRPQSIDFLSGRNVRTNTFPCLSGAVSCSTTGWLLECWAGHAGRTLGSPAEAQKHEVCKCESECVCS